MSALTDFLLARIAEDEEVARRATGADRTGNWWIEPEEGGVSEVSCLDVQGFITAVDVDAAHVSRYDPARVLVECEAKRRIVLESQYWEAQKPTEDERHIGAINAYRRVLQHLSLPYADHADHREEWKT